MNQDRAAPDTTLPWLVSPADAASTEVLGLLVELSQSLLTITGDAGTSSFAVEDLSDPRAVLLVARDVQAVACACGVLRPLDGVCGEVKRMYARPGSRGAGSAVLRALERSALTLGYSELKLSTRRVNERAVAFYRRHGYGECQPYGRYVGRAVSICMGKTLVGLS